MECEKQETIGSMLVSPTKIHVEILISKVMVLGDGILERWLGYEVELSWLGLAPF